MPLPTRVNSWFLALLPLLVAATPALAGDPIIPAPPEFPVVDSAEWFKQPLLGRQACPVFGGASTAPDVAPASTTARVLLFHAIPGFLVTPPGLESLDDGPTDDPFGLDAGPNWIQIAYGDYNPYFDMRRPSDAGGVGYLRIHSQVQLLDVGSTSLCFGLQALTPAGQESGGVSDGTRVVTPGLGVFHDLGDGIALHGYVGQNITSQSTPTDARTAGMHCGMAVQCPVPGVACTADHGCFFFMQALGRVHNDGKPFEWDVVPGIHVRINESCWMSLGASRYSVFTCAWQF